MNKIAKSKDELENDLASQLKLLCVLAEQYDKGDVIVGKSMATSIRILVHDTNNSHSLLGQLGLKNNNFLDTASPVIEDVPGKMQRVGSFCGLVGVSSGTKNGQTYVPYLDETPGGSFGFVSFDEFWNRTIFIDTNRNSFTRKEIVLAIAHQDGGAHVDPDIEEKYKELSRNNSLGWVTSSDGQIWSNSQGSELAAVRQIAHEILRSFMTGYPKKKMVTAGAGLIMGGINILLGGTTDVVQKIISTNNSRKGKVGRNEKCPCGSNEKYKRCHGK
jgi:hypothetical protein